MNSDRLVRGLHAIAATRQLSTQNLTFDHLLGDASSRAYFRVRLSGQTFIAMLLPEVGPSSIAEEITKTSRPITELPFIDVQRLLHEHGVRVPKLEGYSEPDGVLLLEDLGAMLLLDVANGASGENLASLYRTAITELAHIATIPTKPTSSSIAFSRAFDRDLYNWEFLHFVEYGMDHRLKNPPGGADREALLRALGRITDEYLTWEKVLTHRDYHSRNLMVLKSDDGPRMGVIDFQDALLGPAYYDLASLLRDSYIALPPQLQQSLVEEYRLRLKDLSSPAADVGKDEFLRSFHLMGLHRNLKAAGRFCFIDEVKKNPRYLADVPRTLQYVRQTIERYEEMKELRHLMLPHLPELIETCRK